MIKQFTLLLFAIFINLAAQSQCKGVKTSTDEYTGNVTKSFSIPGRSRYSPVTISKITIKDTTKIVLTLHAQSSQFEVNISGVYLLFTDGTKWIKEDEKIDVQPTSGMTSYLAYMVLDESDIELFKTKQIDKFKLSIFERKIPQKDTKDFIEKVVCVTSN